MPGERYTPEQKSAALAAYVTDGAEATSASLGIPARTIRIWAKNAGVTTEVHTKLAEAQEEKRRDIEARKLDLANMFLDAAVDELKRRTASFTETKIVTISGTPTTPGEWQVAEAVREPYAAERKHMVTTAAIAADKAMLLTGGATARLAVQHLNEEERAVASDIFRVINGGKADAA